jgi:cytochrome c biogenesis protein ResB
LLQLIQLGGQLAGTLGFLGVEVLRFTDVGTQVEEREIAGAPFLQSKLTWPAGYQFSLAEFEKVPLAHILSVQYDPGTKVVYVGFTILCLTLIGVFFFSHQRLWIVIEEGKVFFGGDANRNRLGFEDRVNKMIALVKNS